MRKCTRHVNWVHVNRRVLQNRPTKDCVDRGGDDLSGSLLDWSSGIAMLGIAQPIHCCTPSHKSPCGFIDFFEVKDLLLLCLASIRDLTPAEDVQQPPQLVSLVVGWESKLGMCQQWIQNTKISMPQGNCLLRQIQEVTDQDIHQNMQVIGKEVFIGAGSGEDQI